MGTSAIAAVIPREKRIVAAFRQAGANSMAAAIAPAAIGVSEGRAFRNLREHAVLRETGTGLVYLDEPSWQALRATRRLIALVALLIVLFGGIALWFAIR